MMMDLKRELPWLDEQERARCEKYEEMSDEEILHLLRVHAARLDHLPAKHEIPDADYYRKRFGPWPRVLEKAGFSVMEEFEEDGVLSKYLQYTY